MSDVSRSSSNEYGFVNKEIMKDPNISAEAKTIYAYLSSYAGNKDAPFPSVSLICYELNMSENRFYKHRKDLIDKEIMFNKNIEN